MVERQLTSLSIVTGKTPALAVMLLAMFLTACANEGPAPAPPQAVSVFPLLETEPVSSTGDAADDPAIWVHGSDPEASRVLGTDKDFGVEVYDLDGQRVQVIAAGLTNNIDLRYLDNDQNWSALAAASNRSANTISLFLISHEGHLTWLQDSEIVTGLGEPYGLCMFKNAQGLQVFVNDTDGSYQQWGLQLHAPANSDLPHVQATLLREFAVPSQPEGCVADDANERLFVGVEAEGVRTLNANQQASTAMTTLVDIDGTILYADVEGMSLYIAGEAGYLVVSSQGNYSYAVYDRLPPHDYRGSFVISDLSDGSLDGAGETDGLDVSSAFLGTRFADGLLVVQDGINTLPTAAQNFKYIPWSRVADALGL